MVGAVDSCPRRHCRWTLAIAGLVLAVGSIASSASAEAGTLAWTAPHGCPDAASLRARIEHRLARSLDEVSASVDIVVTRNRHGGAFVARIAAGPDTPERTLTSARCNELADAVAVVVVRIASEALSRAELGQHATTPVIVVQNPTTASAQVRDTDTDTDRDTNDAGELVDHGARVRTDGSYVPRAWTIGARVSGISGIGVLPQVGLGGELAITVRAGTHLAELGASRWVASAAQLHAGAPAKVDVNLDVTVARYGWRPAVMPLRAWVAVEVGKMYGGGVDLPTAQIESGRWIAAGTGFGIAWQMTPWVRLVGTTEAMLAIERARFSLGEGMTVYAPSPMSVRTTCGLELGWQ